MRSFPWGIGILAIFALLVTVYAQDIETGDPDTDAIIRTYRQQQKQIPPELLSILPAEFKLTDTNWVIEPTMKTTLSFSLSGTRESEDGYLAEIRLSLLAYNQEQETGRYLIQTSLAQNSGDVEKEWLSSHPAEESADPVSHTSAPEKFKVPAGQAWIQKIHTPAHIDGEGMVPDETLFNGYYIIRYPGGFLYTSVENAKVSRADMERWFTAIASRAAKLPIQKYFNTAAGKKP